MADLTAFALDLRRAARRLPRAVFTPLTFPLVRAMVAVTARLAPRGGAERHRLATGQRLYLHRPATPCADPVPALLWIHGGGLVIGAPELEAELARTIADRLGIVVAAPAYRLAPRHPYPAALDDLDAAFDWLATLPGIDQARLAIGGDSAGGGLAACLAIRRRDGDGPKPCVQLLHQPMLDEATRDRPDPGPDATRMWNGATNRFGWGAYLAGIAGPVPPTASAARLADPAGLAPAWIGCGTADLFHDEAETYATRLAAAGVATRFRSAPGGFHGFATMAPKAETARTYLDDMISALGEGLGLIPG